MTTYAPGTNPFGVMAWDGGDMPLIPRRVTGADRIAQRLDLRFRTDRGTLAGHENDGLNLVDRLQDTMTTRDVATLRAEVNAEALKDPAVQTAYVTVTIDTRAKTQSVSIRAFGDFGQVDVSFTKLADGTLATTS